MEQKIKQIEKQLKFQRIYALITTIALVVFIILTFRNKGNNFGIIRAKGIIITDSLGRERVLIGTPIPFAKNRVRTNLSKVKEAWSKSFPEKYMDWYKEDNNSANGIIILDEQGFDRIAIGNPTPDPNIGKRIGISTGMVINDEFGYERTGYAVTNVDGKNRVVLGLDRNNGTEGATLAILEDGSAGLGINYTKNSLYLGNTNANSFLTRMNQNFFGLIISDNSMAKYNLNSMAKP